MGCRQWRGTWPRSAAVCADSGTTEKRPNGAVLTATATRHALRLYTPADAPAELGDHLTLGQFAEHWVLPRLQAAGRSPRTLDKYRQTLGHWMAATGDPPLGTVDSATAAAFLGHLAAASGRRGGRMTAESRRGHIRRAQAMLDLAGPIRTREDRDNAAEAGLFGQGRLAPKIPAPQAELQPPRPPIAPEILARWLEATEGASTPRLPGIEPGAWWRALLTAAYYTQARRGTLLALEYAWIHTDPADGRHYLALPPRAAKGGRGRLLYCHPAALAAFWSIETPGRRLIFPWPHSARHLDRTRRTIQARAGLEPRTLHDLRKTGATLLATLGGPTAAQHQLGHTTAAVTLAHYVHARAAAATVDRLPPIETP